MDFYSRHLYRWRPIECVVFAQNVIISIHATRTGGDEIGKTKARTFLFTPPIRAATPLQCLFASDVTISIHATCVGSDLRDFRFSSYSFYFYSRHLHGWRRGFLTVLFVVPYISIHATCTGGEIAVEFANAKLISIHATRVGSDCISALAWGATGCISIHATRVGSDGSGKSHDKRRHKFLFTPPVWAATVPYHAFCCCSHDFYSRHPCGQRRISLLLYQLFLTFLFTLPVRVATCCRIVGLPISIHAAHTGSDSVFSRNAAHFYSRHPYGQRRLRPVCEDVVQFLFTPPVRVATAKVYKQTCSFTAMLCDFTNSTANSRIIVSILLTHNAIMPNTLPASARPTHRK